MRWLRRLLGRPNRIVPRIECRRPDCPGARSHVWYHRDRLRLCPGRTVETTQEVAS